MAVTVRFTSRDLRLRLIQMLRAQQTLQSPLLPGFSCWVADFFMAG